MKKLLVVMSTLLLLLFAKIIADLFSLPASAPSPQIKYKNEKINTITSLYNWIDPHIGGNSSLDPSTEDINRLKPFRAKPHSKITFTFKCFCKPKYVQITLLNGKTIIRIKKYTRHQNWSFTSPNKKGVYLYEINGVWDRYHNSAHLFKIKIWHQYFLNLKPNKSISSFLSSFLS